MNAVIRAIDQQFDESIADGRVDRPALARVAFASEQGRAWLEQLLWPRVGERVAAFREQAGA